VISQKLKNFACPPGPVNFDEKS